MKLCRYDHDRIGVVRDGRIFDASAALDELPPLHWPVPYGDQLIANLDDLRPNIEAAADKSTPRALADVTLKSPVANPSKIIAAPVNYRKHLDEAKADAEIHHGTKIKTIDDAGLFLKSTSSLVGAGEGIAMRFPERRNDHEVELAVVIGKQGDRIPRARALDYIAGYAIGLDITVRGPEERSLRKSVDSYSVLGPWMVTADEIASPGNLDFRITVNGEVRQQSNTSYLIFDIPKLIEYASSFYTLNPGDIIMTGTPEGVGPIAAGDEVVAWIDGIGDMTVAVRNA